MSEILDEKNIETTSEEQQKVQKTYQVKKKEDDLSEEVA